MRRVLKLIGHLLLAHNIYFPKFWKHFFQLNVKTYELLGGGMAAMLHYFPYTRLGTLVPRYTRVELSN